MATLTIGTASGGFFNFRGANSTPYAMGSSVVIQNTGGDINTTGGYEGIIITSLSIQCSGYTTTSTLYGNVWNSSGTSITSSSGTSAASDTTATFGAKIFNVTDKFFSTPQTVYVGYSRDAASPTAWDVVNDSNTTVTGNSAGVSPDNLTSSGTGTVFRRLVGTLTYDLYDAGTISRSVTLPTTLKPAVAFGGINGTHAKTITVNWGDGSANQTASIAALRNFSTTALTITKTANYSPGTFPVTTTISSSISDVPDITFSNTVSTVPGAPTALSATAASSTSIDLSWTAPAYANGLSASGGTNGTVTYQLFRGATQINSSSATSFTDTGLDPATLYSYTVKATNTTGQGPASTAATATTQSAVPSSVFSSTFATSTFSSNLSSTFSVNLYVSATANGSAIIRYEASIDNDVTFTSLGLPTNGIVTLSGLTKTTYYTVRVRAVNGLGNSTPVTTSWSGYDFYSGAQYSTTSFTHGGRYKGYIDSESYGQEWAPVYLKKYNGTAFVDIPIQIYNGTVWGYTDA